MKKHTYHDGSVGYRYQVGDLVKFERDYQDSLWRGKIPKGTAAVVLSIHGVYASDAPKDPTTAGIIDNVRVAFMNTYEGKSYRGNVTLHVWNLEPRNERVARQATEISEREASR